MSDNADGRSLRSTLTLALMSPVVVLLLVSIYFATSDFMTWFPLIILGVVVLVFNMFVLRYFFKRAAEADNAPE